MVYKRWYKTERNIIAVVKQEVTENAESTDGFDVECWSNDSQEENSDRKGVISNISDYLS